MSQPRRVRAAKRPHARHDARPARDGADVAVAVVSIVTILVIGMACVVMTDDALYGGESHNVVVSTLRSFVRWLTSR